MISYFKRALSDFIRHRFLHGVCTATIALSVFIISAFTLFFVNAGALMNTWQKGIRVIAYLEPGVNQGARKALIQRIKAFDGVEDVVFISRQKAFSWLKKEIGRQSSLLEGLEDNPLPDSLEIKISRSALNVKDIEYLASRIKTFNAVNGVEYARKWLARFKGVYDLFRITGIILVTMVFIAIMFIVANTIRLILFSRREEIEITRIIGADEEFIRNPFYIEAAMLGFLGGITGITLLFISFALSMPTISPSGILPFFTIRFIPPAAGIAIVISSVIVSWMGCYFSIRRFLHM
ncbi:MAG: ABC transporter permease [Deltaproteobacteria bacterium]|nr:ABC transporter permease [Deltaproteobacteria bacterium]